MILIVTQEKYDKSSDDIIDWISIQKGDFCRINGDTLYSKLNTNSFFIDNKNSSCYSQLNKLQINIGWYRRWSNKEFLEPFYFTKKIFGHAVEISRILVTDESIVRSYFLFSLGLKKWLNEPSKTIANKLIILHLAKEFGLLIPDTIICNSKKELQKFYSEKKSIITKDISNPYLFTLKNGVRFVSYTKEVSIELIHSLPENFMPSLFQKKIQKRYEIRVFYIDKEFFSMAIFSQSSKKTSVDFRDYNDEEPNRTVPYKLPSIIKTKLEKLLQKLQLNSASIDIIRDDLDGEYVFLEINPIGQFGMTSFPCNYYLEKKIAKYLIKNDKL